MTVCGWKWIKYKIIELCSIYIYNAVLHNTLKPGVTITTNLCYLSLWVTFHLINICDHLALTFLHLQGTVLWRNLVYQYRLWLHDVDLLLTDCGFYLFQTVLQVVKYPTPQSRSWKRSKDEARYSLLDATLKQHFFQCWLDIWNVYKSLEYFLNVFIKYLHLCFPLQWYINLKCKIGFALDISKILI